MGYVSIPLVVCIVLLIHHVAATEASRRSKLLVTVLVAVSIMIGRFFPHWSLLSMLTQVGAGIYMLVWLKIRRDLGR